MKKVLKFLLILIAIVVVGIAALLTYLKTALPNVGPAPDLKVEATPERIERGKYLANYVMVCIDCHSSRDWSLFAGPIVRGTEGKGGDVFDQTLGFPGAYVAKNITPAALSSWTDGEIFRAITTGVSKDGHPLFPIMPYPNFGQLDEEDIKSVIAYIRTLPGIENAPAKSHSDFPMNFIINTIPQKAKLVKAPSRDNTVEYGKYLVTAASCHTCHTRQEKGKFVGEDFAGGREFPFPDGSIARSANITPHATGIGNWTEEMFMKKFRQYSDSTYQDRKVTPGTQQTLMPWTMYTHMEDRDLKAIFAYLKTLPPVDNFPEKFTTASSVSK
ncbi:MAG: cytochrome c [Saprospiraceae bacterium]